MKTKNDRFSLGGPAIPMAGRRSRKRLVLEGRTVLIAALWPTRQDRPLVAARSSHRNGWTTLQCAAVAVCLAIVIIPGCGGGASATPTVRYLPSETAAPGAAAIPGDTAAPSTTDVAGTGVGIIEGTVVVQGDFKPLPPRFAKGAATKDPAVCGAEAVPNEDVVVNNGGLANVFIYLQKAPKGNIPAAPAEPVIFDQKYCVFKPHALLVRTGQTVQVINSDATAHNTRNNPKRNSGFNQILSPNDSTGIKVVYTKPEVDPVQVGCDIHTWMTGFHLPVDHPFAAVSDANGKFTIKDLPAGKHQFKVWHEKGGVLEKAFSVTVKPNETTTVEIPVGAARLAHFEGPAPKLVQLSSNAFGEIPK